MSPTQMLVRPRSGAPLTALRWLLTGLVFVGVFAMHVLSAHDTTDHDLRIDHAVPAPTAEHHPATVVVGQPSGEQSAGTRQSSTGDDPDWPVAACILALVVAGGVLLLTTIGGRRRRILTSVASGFAAIDLPTPFRWPPRIGRPRISLCVQRV